MIRRRVFSSRPALSDLAGVLLLLGLPVVAACGKKGPPLPPLQLTPGRIEDLAAARREEAVRIRLTVPKTSSDGKPTRDIAAVELYGLSGKAEDPFGRPLGTEDLLKYATLVGRAAIKPPPIEPTPEQEEKAEKAERAGKPPKPAPPFDPRPGQGDVVTFNEAITPDVTKPWVHPKRKVKADEDEKKEVPPGTPLWWPIEEDQFSRVYVAVALNKNGKHGPLSNRVSMPLMEPAGPPATIATDFTQAGIDVTWTAPTTGVHQTMYPGTPPGLVPIKPLVFGASPTLYNVYDATRRTSSTATPAAAPAADGNPVSAAAAAAAAASAPKPEIVSGPGGEFVIAPTPLNASPLNAPPYVDGRLAFGQERCYVVRSTAKFGSASVESSPSAVSCVTPIDKFPPEAPKNLSAVGGENGVSLIWEPNTEPDLAGYIVMRAEVPADGSAPKMTPLTPQPIPDTTYRDGTARPGVRYVYAVVAVDRATPRNTSETSNLVEATVR